MLGQLEVVVLFLDENNLAPFRAELPLGIAFLVGQELLLANAVKAAVLGFIELPLVKEPLNDLLHAILVERIGGSRPRVIPDFQLLPKSDKLPGQPLHELQRSDPLFLRGLLDLLPVLVDPGQEVDTPGAARLLLEPLVSGDRVG